MLAKGVAGAEPVKKIKGHPARWPSEKVGSPQWTLFATFCAHLIRPCR